jgi:5'-nucleotidase
MPEQHLSKAKLILVDQDGVLANFESGFYAAWQAAGHPHPALPLEQRRSFYVRDDYPAALRAEVEAIYTAPGFYRDLPAISGAVEALTTLLEQGHDVRICTSPLTQYRHCVPEKYEWVERHLGAEFVTRMIVSKDKTIVHGDLLVDDNPQIKGPCTPSWQHVIFDQPYNRQVEGTRMNWANWRDVLAL